MAILEEAAHLVKEHLGTDFDNLTIERLVVGLFFTGVKLSNSTGGDLLYAYQGNTGSSLLPEFRRQNL